MFYLSKKKQDESIPYICQGDYYIHLNKKIKRKEAQFNSLAPEI